MALTTLDHTVQVREMILTGEARRLRLDAKISLSSIAQEVGVSIATVSHWELNRRQPRGKGALRYLQALNKIRPLAATMTGVA